MRARVVLWSKANDQAARHLAMHRMPPTDQCLDPDPRAAHEVEFLFSDANADMWTAGFVSIRMTNLDDVRLRTA